MLAPARAETADPTANLPPNLLGRALQRTAPRLRVHCLYIYFLVLLRPLEIPTLVWRRGGGRGGCGWRAATRAHLPRDLMKEAAPVAAVSNEVAAVALVISALALGAQSSALR